MKINFTSRPRNKHFKVHKNNFHFIRELHEESIHQLLMIRLREKRSILNFISIAYVRDLKRLQTNGEVFHSIIHHYFPLLHRHARQAYLLKGELCTTVPFNSSTEKNYQQKTMTEIVLMLHLTSF